MKINKEPLTLYKRLNSLKNIIYFKGLNKNYTKKNNDEGKIWSNILFFIVLIIFSISIITYFSLFYLYVIDNYDNRFWFVFRLTFTPIIFIILPIFLSKILKNLIYGFFPKDVENFDRQIIKLNKYEFIINWLWIIGLLIFLTLFISWEINVIWLSFLIILLILIFVIFKITSSKFSKYA
jgi:hypothetical protein